MNALRPCSAVLIFKSPKKNHPALPAGFFYACHLRINEVTTPAERTHTTKRNAITTMLQDPEWVSWSDRKIAETCAVGYSLVSDVRKSIYPNRVDAPTTRTVERNGKGKQSA